MSFDHRTFSGFFVFWFMLATTLAVAQCEPRVSMARSDCYEVVGELTSWPVPGGSLVLIRIRQKVVGKEPMMAPAIEMVLDGKEETDFVGRRSSWDILRYGTDDFRVHDIRVLAKDVSQHRIVLHFSYPRDLLTKEVLHPECSCSLEFEFHSNGEADYSAWDIELLSEYRSQMGLPESAEADAGEETASHEASEIAAFLSKLYRDSARDGTSKEPSILRESQFWRSAVRWYAPLVVYPLLKDLNHPESLGDEEAAELSDWFSLLECPALSCEGWLMKLAIVLGSCSGDNELAKRIEAEGRESCARFPVSLSLIDGMLATAGGSMKYDSTFRWFLGNPGGEEARPAGR